MKKTAVILILMAMLSGCTLVAGGKEAEETIRVIQENYRRYGNPGIRWYSSGLQKCNKLNFS